MNQNEVYVGARYVPVFADPVEWSSDRDYEPLTIVTHNYDTYTSRQYVPEGIDIDNPLFWVKSGNTGGVIGDFTEQIKALHDDIGTAQTDIGTLQTDVGTLQANVGTLGTTVGNNTTAIGTLQTSVGNNTTAIGALQAGVTALSDAIAAISSTYSSVQTMLDDYNAMSAADLAEKVGEVVRTACFVDMTNGGGAFYQLVNDATLTANNMDMFGLNTADYFIKLVPDAVVSLEQFGIVSSATTGYAGVATHTAIAYVCNNYAQVVGNGTYNISESVTFAGNNKTIKVNLIKSATGSIPIYITGLSNSQLKVGISTNHLTALYANANSSASKVVNNILFISTTSGVTMSGTNLTNNSVTIFNANEVTLGRNNTYYLFEVGRIILNAGTPTIYISNRLIALSELNIGACQYASIYTNNFINPSILRYTSNNTFCFIYGVFFVNNRFIAKYAVVKQGKLIFVNDNLVYHKALSTTEEYNINLYATYIYADSGQTYNISLSKDIYGYDATPYVYIDNSNQNINVSYPNASNTLVQIFNGASLNASVYKIEWFINNKYSITEMNTSVIA